MKEKAMKCWLLVLLGMFNFLSPAQSEMTLEQCKAKALDATSLYEVAISLPSLSDRERVIVATALASEMFEMWRQYAHKIENDSYTVIGYQWHENKEITLPWGEKTTPEKRVVHLTRMWNAITESMFPDKSNFDENNPFAPWNLVWVQRPELHHMAVEKFYTLRLEQEALRRAGLIKEANSLMLQILLAQQTAREGNLLSQDISSSLAPVSKNIILKTPLSVVAKGATSWGALAGYALMTANGYGDWCAKNN